MAGRNTKLTPKTKAGLCDLIRSGLHNQTACDIMRISTSSFYHWRSTFPEFSDALKKAEAEAEAEMVKRIMAAATTTWQATAWYLERKFSSRWGKVDRIQISQAEDEVREMTDDELVAFIAQGGDQGAEPGRLRISARLPGD